MFKNCVFRPSVDTVEWFKAASVRAVITMANAAIAAIGVGTTMNDVDWKVVLSTAVLSGILSILTSVAGIKEVQAKE